MTVLNSLNGDLCQKSDPWKRLRSEEFLETVRAAILETKPAGISINSMQHVRTAHYVACRVETLDKAYLVRVGVIEPSNNDPIDNSGFLQTSTFVPTGQKREYNLALELASSNVSVAIPEYFSTYTNFDNDVRLDVIWIPFLEDSGGIMTASQWGETLRPLHSMNSSETLPVFTNRSKTFARLDNMTDTELSENFAKEYDEALSDLFDVATKWSPVHGDAHCGNVLITSSGRPVLFDFDTMCWAPSVWDLTHLLTRVGTDRNTGYTFDSLVSEFDFSSSEIKAALRLRSVATRVARAVR